MARVVVGLSGGVDSSVAAHQLIEQGHEVIGLFMRNWVDESVIIDAECPWVEDSNDAMLVAEKLGIPFQVIDLSEEYKERIVDYMFYEYEHGRTPNPDVLCNREIKFDTFLKAALQLKADYVATGHYCRKMTTLDENNEPIHHLLKGLDPNKDQSYFLCQLNQDQLSKALFPIGHLEKPEVRRIAAELDLVTADKKDSQGLCFIGKVRLPDFLQQQLKPKKGQIVEIPLDAPLYGNDHRAEGPNWLQESSKAFQYKLEDGKVIGEHQGAHYFTVGQRKGLAVGGTKDPLFVVGTDVDENVIYTGQSHQHPGLWRHGLYIKNEEIHWVRSDLALKIGGEMEVDARFRYRQPLQKAKLYRTEDGMYVIFEERQSAITPGQFAAWYIGDELLGSGVINE